MARRRGLLSAVLVISSGTAGPLGCRDAGPSGSGQSTSTKAAPARGALDLGAIRASAVEGFEAAARDDTHAARVGLARAVEGEAVEGALGPLSRRAGADPAVEGEAERLFASLTTGPAMRGVLVDMAREHPELDVAGLTAGLPDYVSQRLTRPELIAELRAELRRRGRELDPALARALLIDGHGARALAVQVAFHVGALAEAGDLDEALGRDREAIQRRLERRLGDPARAAGFLTALGDWLAEGPGPELLASVLASDEAARLLASGLTRILADDRACARLETLFGVALAAELTPDQLRHELDGLLAEPVIAREAAAWLVGLARDQGTRAAVTACIEQFAATPAFDAAARELVT